MAVPFDTFPEQDEAKHLLRSALAEGPAHAYLFHGPRGVGKRAAALAFAGELLGAPQRVARRAHADLYVLEPLGDQIRIDPIRELRRDLHMRPFEADRRVYLVFGAHLLNEDAADALLKDLEEPPEYAVIVLVADELGPLPPTIVSRCQRVPFRRLSQRAIREVLAERGVFGPELDALSRVAAGRLDRAERLLDPDARERRVTLIGLARSVYLDEDFEPRHAAGVVGEFAKKRGDLARASAEAEEQGDETEKQAEQRATRAAAGAEREAVLDALELLASWYRDLVVVAAGATGAALNSDRVEELNADASPELALAAERAVEVCRDVWRTYEELNLQQGLALEALFVRLRRKLVTSLVALGHN
jgi:DNA polymerase-3 subunit delta'